MAVDADRFQDSNPKTCVVLGGRGFIGKSLVLQLLKLGNWIVRIADSTHSIQLHHSESLLAEALSSSRASYVHLDLTDKHRIAKGNRSIDAIFFRSSFNSLTMSFCAVLEGSSVVFYLDVDSSNNGDDFCSSYKLIVQGTL